MRSLGASMRSPLLLLALLPALAHAQVNAEVLRPNPLRAGLSGGLDASLALARGNVNLLDVGGAGRVQFQTLHPVTAPDELPFVAQRAFLTLSGRYSENGGRVLLSQAFAHARWTGMWHPRVGSDVFAQYQYNQFLRLQGRAIAGAGVRVEAVHLKDFMLWGGSGYLFEYDRVTVQPGAADAPETFEHRWTNYLTARLALFEAHLLLQNTVYFQPRFDAFADFRLLEELEVLAKVTEVLALGLTVSVLYDSAPPTGVVPTDLRLVSTVRLTF